MRRMSKIAMLVAGVVGFGSLIAAPGEAAAPYATSEETLDDVSVLSPTDAWAVGSRLTWPTETTLVEHWDGHTWSEVASPSPGDQVNVLRSVEAISANDVWAVGDSAVGDDYSALIEHWDGVSWTVMASPAAWLTSVSAGGPNDVWAVGGIGGPGGDYSFAEHWNGSRWTVVSTDPLESFFLGVWAAGSGDAWAVSSPATRIDHWDGASWTEVDTSPGRLWDIEGTSTSDVWAVGEGASSTLAEHWNGKSWKVTQPPRGTRSRDTLEDLAVISPTDAWAVGYRGHRRSDPTPLIEHWDGSNWQRTTLPSATASDRALVLAGVDGSRSDDVWAVGNSYGAGIAMVHWDGTTWRKYPIG